MFIKEISIKNFRLFSNGIEFKIEDFNIPNNSNEGSGLNVIVGENGCGKTSLLDALSLPLLGYKTESFSLNDFSNPGEKCKIKILSGVNFNYSGTMPRVTYIGKGFEFEAGVRSRGAAQYLSSSIVTDQKYVRADGETKPEDGKPDLRLSVNNPWSGTRFNENDILFLDKNRIFQIRSGTYNDTRFDRLMEDFNFQYLKQSGNPLDCNGLLNTVNSGINNSFLIQAVNKFEELSSYKLNLSLIENYKPFSNGFFGVEKENKQIVSLSNLGSGYEMIFSLLYSFYLSKQSGKQLVILIDEPELHLHPKLQEDFIKVLLDISKESQVFITTHSPLFIKQVLYNQIVKIYILKKESNNLEVSSIDNIVLPYISSNEINFLAFDLPTEEYHNELYEELKTINGEKLNIKDFDLHYFQQNKGEQPIYTCGTTSQYNCTIHTFLRNQIHHRGTNGQADSVQIKQSIIKMREFLI